jgi:AAA domain
MTIEFNEQAYQRAKTGGSAQPKSERTGDHAGHGATPFPFVLAHDITLKPKEFLIEGFLGRYEVSAWYGAPDSAKSVVMVHAQACVAAGIEFCGRRVTQGPCL